MAVWEAGPLRTTTWMLKQGVGGVRYLRDIYRSSGSIPPQARERRQREIGVIYHRMASLSLDLAPPIYLPLMSAIVLALLSLLSYILITLVTQYVPCLTYNYFLAGRADPMCS